MPRAELSPGPTRSPPAPACCPQRPEFHRWRALIFCSLGLWGIVPIFHGWYVNWGVAPVAFALGLDLLMGAIYLGQSVSVCVFK